MKLLLTVTLLSILSALPGAEITGDLSVWGKVTLTFDGPKLEEKDPDTFMNHRLEVEFVNGESMVKVPGFFAADGEAAQSHSRAGNQWRAHFTPHRSGTWSYLATLVRGPKVAIDSQLPGEAIALEDATGTIEITKSRAHRAEADFRSQGILEYVGKRYLQFGGSKRYFLKGGAGSPENLLAYKGFDGTRDYAQTPEFPSLGEDQLHHYTPHLKDWKPGDPSWTDEEGDEAKSIIGLINYVAGQGLNSFYIMPMTFAGDGNDVWPWIDPTERRTFDISKLAQWELFFDHMQQKGILLHLLLTETENESLFEVEDGPGDFADTRKLYYREMIARFAHHPALIWNIGEESGWDDEKGGELGRGITSQQRKQFCAYIRMLDPYNHPIQAHDIEIVEIYEDLLGFDFFEGPSLQRHSDYNAVVHQWIQKSANAGRPWIVSVDEPLGWEYGLRPDAENSHQDIPRKNVLWGTYCAGGYGVEFYFGWQNNSPTSDLSVEDMRTRENMWKQVDIALGFFNQYLPFHEMEAANELVNTHGDYVFTKKGEIYVVYLKNADPAQLDLSGVKGTYTVEWFNPRDGGALQKGSVETVSAGQWVDIGLPQGGTGTDWVALLRRKNEALHTE